MNRNHDSLNRSSLAVNLLIALSMVFSTGFISQVQVNLPENKNSHPGESNLAQEEQPTLEPTQAIPTESPTEEPTQAIPTETPTEEPMAAPTQEPTLESPLEPTSEITLEATPEPSSEPTLEPPSESTLEPTPTDVILPTPTLDPTIEITPILEPSLTFVPEMTNSLIDTLGFDGDGLDQTSITEIISDNPDPGIVNEPYTVYVIVSGSSGTPSGSIDIDDGAVPRP